MDNKTVADALCGIDDKYLSEYDSLASNVKVKKMRNKKIIASAVCAALVAAAGAGLYFGRVFNRPGVMPANSVEPAVTDAVDASEGGTLNGIASDSAADDYSQSVLPVTTPTEGNTAEDVFSVTDEDVAGVTAATSDPASVSDSKGGDTPVLLQDYTYSDGGYYKIFKPGEDIFAPLDNMTLANRFCSVQYNGLSYYPTEAAAVAGEELSNADYESSVLKTVKAFHYELRSADAADNIVGIAYAANVEIHKLTAADTEEAIACVVSFNGETGVYKYLCNSRN